MNARRFTIRVRGITPLIMNNNAAMVDGSAEDKGRDKLQWEKDHMMERTYQNTSGALIIPARAIKKALINGCRFVTDKPKGTSFKSFGPLIEGALIVEDDAVIDVSADKAIPYIAIVNLNPSKGPSGPKGPRCRPMVPLPWNAETVCSVLDDALTETHFANIAEAAGKFVGLLDGRRVDFGRAEITIKRIK